MTSHRPTSHRQRPATTVALGLLALLGLLPACRVTAHEGPPFPLIVDRPVGPRLVSVWGDPDIGTATFFVVMEPVNGGELPAGTRVRIGVQPISGRLAEVLYDAEPQRVHYGARYIARPELDRGEMWRVRVLVEGPQGDELTAEVEATPDGSIGPIGLVLYVLPFLAAGFLWLKLVLGRRQAQGAREPALDEEGRPARTNSSQRARRGSPSGQAASNSARISSRGSTPRASR